MDTIDIFESARNLLSDTFLGYRYESSDFIAATNMCMSYLFDKHSDRFLDNNFQVTNDYNSPKEHKNSYSYRVGDMVYMNDPLEIYVCTVSGTSDSVTPVFDGYSVSDGIVLWSKWYFPDSFNSSVFIHYICWYCFMLDNDEQANINLANQHQQLYLGAI